MKLTDECTGCWYTKLDKTKTNKEEWISYTSISFGTGRKNTKDMLTKWNADLYGTKDTTNDVWRCINIAEGETEINWFIPSKEEWAAFAGELGINTGNYMTYGLGKIYWSSSQSYHANGFCAWAILFSSGYMSSGGVDQIIISDSIVRLSTTF